MDDFKILNNGVLAAYTGPGGEVIVPGKVTAIGREAFIGCARVTSVVLPEGVRVIGEAAFKKSGIRGIVLPDSLREISGQAFAETPLEKINIPDGVKSIGEGAFFAAKRLASVRLPKGTERLAEELFRECISLEKIDIPDTVKYISESAFYGCISLKKIHFPKHLEVIEQSAFKNCAALEELMLPYKVEVIETEAFAGCERLKKVYLPESIREIGQDAFAGDMSLKLSGPNVRGGAVYGEEELIYVSPEVTELTVEPGMEIYEGVLSGLKNLKYLKLPDWLETLDTYALKGLGTLEVLELPEELTYYDWRAFRDLKSLKKVIAVPGTVSAEIGSLLNVETYDKEGRPFTYTCPKRSGEWYTEPDTVHGGVCLTGCRGEVGRTGEADCTTLYLPDRINGQPVTSVDAFAFSDYEGADALYIPDTVLSIGERAFASMDLTYARVPIKAEWTEEAFADNENLLLSDGRILFETHSGWEEEEAWEDGEEAWEDDREENDRTEETGKAAQDLARMIEDAAGSVESGGGNILYFKQQTDAWNYFTGLTREERIRELTHDLLISGTVDGAGWATVLISVDAYMTRFRISDIGASPEDFKTFAREIRNGGSGSFGWSGEPGWYGWKIERRREVLYVCFPQIEQCVFIPREQFLTALEDLNGEW